MSRRGIILFTALFFSLVSFYGYALEFKGVIFEDRLTIGDTDCVLNGVGIRKKFFVEVYYGGLYLPQKTGDSRAVIEMDVPKAVVLKVVYKKVDAEKWREGWVEGFKKTAESYGGDLKERIDRFVSFFDEPVVKGEEVRVVYVPNRGTEVIVKGRSKGVIPGSDFMKALWAIWFGEEPASEELKKGMLGM
ncbi:chalcone isomerase family protein [Thermodesulforhabdus norvegica]|uniref:Chalcone isomerase-like n=1 Tax=Thermodesulforhabdus norvegica TaxID=39841 RepID=A0A1I4QLV2_9BACT|nr:chalcone isomerase family protein [Thermodesulforhabdus norvegica]SFM40736.1 Chalcone isomerase-like [Thermodesulforhabdus norvegica]